MRLHTNHTRELPVAPEEGVARFSAVAVPATLAALSALHASWALGSYWPAGSESELAEYVLSEEERDRLAGGLPPAGLTWAVAVALAGAAAAVRATASGPRPRWLRRATAGVAAAFLIRAVAYVPSDLSGGPKDTYQRLDLALYAPLCLGLAAGTALVLRGDRDGVAGPPLQPEEVHA